MKKLIAILLLLALMLPSMGLAQDMVSISELHAQAEALGGRWQGTYETKKGTVTIDAPIIVPDVETLPVITVEGVKASQELYEQVIAGERPKNASKRSINYVIEMNGEPCRISLGYEYDDLHGYDAVNMFEIGRGLFSTGYLEYAAPSTYHHAWEFDAQKPSLRDKELTLETAMRLWHKDIEMFFPGESFELAPVEINARGSLLTDETGKKTAYKNEAYYYISAEQIIGGVPLIGDIVDQYGHTSYANEEDQELREMGTYVAEKKRKKYGTGIGAVIGNGLLTLAYFASEEDYQIHTTLVRTRTVEFSDVPLASLDSVIASLAERVEKGKIGAVNSVRLGYILYSNPDMTDHAWAIPRWVVEYATPDEVGRDVGIDPWGCSPDYPWVYYQSVLVDAQSGDVILFGVGDETTLSVPKLTTWDDVN